jgi:hypothetical protein
MRQPRRPSAFVALAALVALMAVPAVTLAAEPLTVTGSVVRDGAPVVGVEVVVSISGSDVIGSTATDEQGRFSVEVEASVGDVVAVFATGQTSRTGPDRQGCVRTETPVGETSAVIESLPPAPVTVELETVLTSTVCTATATPGRPGVTPPSTDGPMEARRSPAPGGGLLVVLGLLALMGGASLALARRRG